MFTKCRQALLVAILAGMMYAPVTLAAPDIQVPDDGITISMDLQDASLKDVLKIFSIQSGMNFIASEGVQERKLTLYLDKVPLKEAMDKLFTANNLSYELSRDSNVIIVKDWGKPELETVTKVFYLRYATVSTASMKEEMNNLLKKTTEIGDIQSETSSSSSSSSSSNSSGDKGKWKQEEDAGITQAVKKILSENGKVIEDFRTNSLIVSDTPQRMEVISQVIAALDVPLSQVMLEVEMLDVSKGTVDKLGVNWPETLASLYVSGSKATSFPFRKDAGTNVAGTDLAGSVATTAAEWSPASWAANKFGPSLLTIIGDTLTLDFLRTQTDTKILARPKILTVNNEPAEIKITANTVIGLKSTTDNSGGGSTTTIEAERAETGISLRITPQINMETNEVTLFIVPAVAETTKSPFVANIGGVITEFFNNEVRKTKALVKVKDGETVIIGGLIHTKDTTISKSVPVFSKIPIIGGAFRHKANDPGVERELLVFITPRLIKDSVPASPVRMKASIDREQNTAEGMDRQIMISSSLSNFETRQR